MNQELLQSFFTQATQMRFCFFTEAEVRASQCFSFAFSEVNIYTGTAPHKVYRLVMFARMHAKLHGADVETQSNAYGLLSRVALTSDLVANHAVLTWGHSLYEENDPSRISLNEWLEMNELPIPKFVTEPLA